RQRRRHRARPPGRRDGRAADHHRAARAGTVGPIHGADHHVRRGRPGHRHDHRARQVTARKSYAEQRTVDLGFGVWSVPVPIPGNPLGYTLVYAVESPRGPVLVDAGWNHPDAWAALRDGLAAAGMDVAEVHGVVVTHFHPDHAGLAGQVREASGAWVAMHEADAAIVDLKNGVSPDARRSFQADMLRRAGAPDEDVPGDSDGARPQPPAPADRRLRDGDLADLPGRKLRVVHTPGHTPGHVCLHLEDADRLFT